MLVEVLFYNLYQIAESCWDCLGDKWHCSLDSSPSPFLSSPLSYSALSAAVNLWAAKTGPDWSSCRMGDKWHPVLLLRRCCLAVSAGVQIICFQLRSEEDDIGVGLFVEIPLFSFISKSGAVPVVGWAEGLQLSPASGGHKSAHSTAFVVLVLLPAPSPLQLSHPGRQLKNSLNCSLYVQRSLLHV